MSQQHNNLAHHHVQQLCSRQATKLQSKIQNQFTVSSSQWYPRLLLRHSCRCTHSIRQPFIQVFAFYRRNRPLVIALVVNRAHPTRHARPRRTAASVPNGPVLPFIRGIYALNFPIVDKSIEYFFDTGVGERLGCDFGEFEAGSEGKQGWVAGKVGWVNGAGFAGREGLRAMRIDGREKSERRLGEVKESK